MLSEMQMNISTYSMQGMTWYFAEGIPISKVKSTEDSSQS